MPEQADSFTLRVGDGGMPCRTAPPQTLLAAMEQAGIAWPSACRNGTCRTCMGLMREGRVRYAIEWPGLLAEEKAEGWILPCCAHPLADVVLDEPRF